MEDVWNGQYHVKNMQIYWEFVNIWILSNKELYIM